MVCCQQSYTHFYGLNLLAMQYWVTNRLLRFPVSLSLLETGLHCCTFLLLVWSSMDNITMGSLAWPLGPPTKWDPWQNVSFAFPIGGPVYKCAFCIYHPVDNRFEFWKCMGQMTWTIWVIWVTFLEGQVGLICKLNYMDVTRISHVL